MMHGADTSPWRRCVSSIAAMFSLLQSCLSYAFHLFRSLECPSIPK